MCLSDYIIPGHGQTFRVTREMKEQAKCSQAQAKRAAEVYHHNNNTDDITVDTSSTRTTVPLPRTLYLKTNSTTTTGDNLKT